MINALIWTAQITTALFRLQVEAVRLIAEGKAPRIIQPQEGATYECIQKKDNAKVKLQQCFGDT